MRVSPTWTVGRRPWLHPDSGRRCKASSTDTHFPGILDFALMLTSLQRIFSKKWTAKLDTMAAQK